MQIVRISMPARDLDAQARFYADRLGLPVHRSDRLRVEVGPTILEFFECEAHPQHFAFNVPADRFADAKAWIAERAGLVQDGQGADEFRFEAWHARAAYFRDPDGNLLEIIARQNRPLRVTSQGQFLVELSEIGIACRDVELSVANLGIPPYGLTLEDFAPVGDEQGLLILARAGRTWYPNIGLTAHGVEGSVEFVENGQPRTIGLRLA